MLNTYEQHSNKKLIVTVLSIIVIAGAVVLTDHLKSKSTTTATVAATTQTTSTAAATTTPTSVAATTSTSTAKDGSYNASSSYYVPAGTETIQVSLTVKDGTVSDVSIKNSESDPESADYQQGFAKRYMTAVVGKKISGLKIGSVAGASDTTQGFNDALSQIATKAQA